MASKPREEQGPAGTASSDGDGRGAVDGTSTQNEGSSDGESEYDTFTVEGDSSLEQDSDDDDGEGEEEEDDDDDEEEYGRLLRRKMSQSSAASSAVSSSSPAKANPIFEGANRALEEQLSRQLNALQTRFDEKNHTLKGLSQKREDAALSLHEAQRVSDALCAEIKAQEAAQQRCKAEIKELDESISKATEEHAQTTKLVESESNAVEVARAELNSSLAALREIRERNEAAASAAEVRATSHDDDKLTNQHTDRSTGPPTDLECGRTGLTHHKRPY
eukprot:GHVU01060015.1.p1 GENE.GHVU01060015.1~~GHVU01060015.1.p1  ORF type:complete len:276 (-),score=57.06 GHVU01060015.1:520-1347(-)